MKRSTDSKNSISNLGWFMVAIPLAMLLVLRQLPSAFAKTWGELWSTTTKRHSDSEQTIEGSAAEDLPSSDQISGELVSPVVLGAYPRIYAPSDGLQCSAGSRGEDVDAEGQPQGIIADAFAASSDEEFYTQMGISNC